MTAGQRLAEIDAVTIDAFGTLLELREPVRSLARLLPGFDRDAVARAFRTENEFYVARSHEGRDAESLTRLRAAATQVFNDALGSSLTPGEFVGALEFTFVDRALETLETLAAHGVAVCIVSNWDIGLHDWLDGLGIPVVTSAEAGAPKPHPRVFRLALERLGVDASRTLHVGDSDTDERGAAAAGIRFARAPLAEAVGAWT